MEITPEILDAMEHDARVATGLEQNRSHAKGTVPALVDEVRRLWRELERKDVVIEARNKLIESDTDLQLRQWMEIRKLRGQIAELKKTPVRKRKR